MSAAGSPQMAQEATVHGQLARAAVALRPSLLLLAAAVAASPAQAADSGYFAAYVDGSKLNVANIDVSGGRSVGLGLIMTGKTNILSARIASGQDVTLDVLQQGGTNNADADVKGHMVTTAITQTSTPIVSASSNGTQWIEGTTGDGTYVTVYTSNEFGYFEATSTAPVTGRLGR
jgi:hypothetical protein